MNLKQAIRHKEEKMSEQTNSNKKMDIKLRFGEMFVKHMLGVIGDFKDLLQTEFDNINQMEDN